MKVPLPVSASPSPRSAFPTAILVAGVIFVAGWPMTLPAGTPTPTPTPPWPGVPVVQPTIPPDSRGTSQSAFNNLAWQQFIALNWVADPNSPGQPDPKVPPSAFGTQLDSRPLVWESFKEASEVFQPNATPPTSWKAARMLPSALSAPAGKAKLKATSKLGVKGLFAVSKFTGGPQLDLSEFGEAFTGGSWLTAQARMNNYITLYEKRLNPDEFNYINTNHLYNAAVQSPFALNPGLNLPDGSATFSQYGTTGAIEIKAAWIELDDKALWPLFKISQAYVSYPSAKGPTPPKLVTVGLVGLHIIRKTPNAQQFIWSTFEHVNNAPSVTDIQNKTLKAWYTYYNPACNPATDPYQCVQNYQPVPCTPSPCTNPYGAPVQVVRTTPISTSTSNNIAQLNTNTWTTIAAANPKSVFLNYQLVNVLWPNDNTSIPAGATVPLTDGNATPKQSQQPVANTVLETYHQNLNCLACHTFAPVASTASTKTAITVKAPLRSAGVTPAVQASPTPPPALASDYSFLFSEAQMPPPSPTPAAAKP
ncbi:MAG: hypothetical protein QOH88_2775 [Verrucomicrobiota bacterium]